MADASQVIDRASRLEAGRFECMRHAAQLLGLGAGVRLTKARRARMIEVAREMWSAIEAHGHVLDDPSEAAGFTASHKKRG